MTTHASPGSLDDEMSAVQPSNSAFAALAAAGYEPRREELLAVAGLLARPAGAAGARALILEGPPGSGKSALAEALAAALASELVVCQLHAWTDADELFAGVDVAAAVAGDAEHVRQPGALAVAAAASERASAERPAVLLLDELDKSPERAEALLLDVLQSGRVPVRPGEHVRIVLAHLLVVITSNGARPLSDALLRRCRRVAMRPLAAEVVERLVRERVPGATAGLARAARVAATEAAERDGAVASVQEVCALAAEALAVAESAADVALALAGWGARGEAGREWALGRGGAARVASLWDEVRRARRARGTAC